MNRRELMNKGVAIAVIAFAIPALMSCTPEEIANASNSSTTDTDDTTYSGNWASGGTNLITSDYPATSIFTGATIQIVMVELILKLVFPVGTQGE